MAPQERTDRAENLPTIRYVSDGALLPTIAPRTGMPNRVDELEATVEDLEETVAGLKEELVALRSRVRELDERTADEVVDSEVDFDDGEIIVS